MPAETMPPPPTAHSPPPSAAQEPKPASVKPATGFKMPTAVVRGRAIVLNAVEGWGKTTLGAFAPNPVMILASREQGYLTLYGNKRVPAVEYCIAETWNGLIGNLPMVSSGIKTVVVDALGGIERLCHEHVCGTQFKGDWGERGFSSYQKGYELSLTDWMLLLKRLDDLRNERGIDVVILSHAKVRTFKNPLGPDFDRYVADCHEKTWGVTVKWADAVFFGNYFEYTEKEKNSEAKGKGGTTRLLYATHTAAFDAKNRFGMADEIEMPDDPTKLWSTLETAMKGRALNV